MDYIEKIFERSNLQQISQFILYGTKAIKIDNDSYKERLEKAGKSAFDMLQEKCPAMEESIANEIHHYNSVTQDVYMEIGMICGATLITQLLK